jgi:hypothetical protein
MQPFLNALFLPCVGITLSLCGCLAENNSACRNYVAVNIYDLDCYRSIGWGDVAVLADNWLKDESGILDDFDDDNNVDFIDFAIFGLIWQ